MFSGGIERGHPVETLEQGVKYVQSYFTPCSSVSIVNFEHVIAGWPVKWIG